MVWLIQVIYKVKYHGPSLIWCTCSLVSRRSNIISHIMTVSWSTNCPTRISSREKMTEEVFSWPSSRKWYGRPVMVTNLTHFHLRYRTRLILELVSQDLQTKNLSSWMKGLFYSRGWGGQNWYLTLYNDRSETWHVVFFSNLRSVTDPQQICFYSC